MNQLTKMFEGQELRIAGDELNPLFLLKDVCSILGLEQVAGVKRRLDDDVISNHPIRDALGRTQQATFVNEDGLYDVVLESRKPEAKSFRKWITSEVIPSIRKTGGYQLQPKSQAELTAMIAQQAVDQERRITVVEEKQDNIVSILSLDITKWRDEVNRIINSIAMKLGGGAYYSEIRNESYELLESRAGCNLDIRLQNRKSKMALRGSSKTAINKITKLEIISEDKKLISVYFTVIKEMAVKYQLNLSKYQLTEAAE